MTTADRIARLLATQDAQERNKLAVRLADDGVAEAIPAIRTLLQRPDTAGCRGTLLYALSEFPIAALDEDTLRVVGALAADPLETGEARSEAQMLIDNRQIAEPQR